MTRQISTLSTFGWTSPAATAVAALLSTLVLVLVASQSAQAQTFRVIHDFSGTDGARPSTGLTIDAEGNLYGTAAAGGVSQILGDECRPGGAHGCGTVFQLRPSGSGWQLTTLHNFQGRSDGFEPYAKLHLASDGSLYGTTIQGGQFSCGTLYRLVPPGGEDRTWNTTVLYAFDGYTACSPDGDLTFDHSGNIYGGAFPSYSDYQGGGVIWEFTSQSRPVEILYNFPDGYYLGAFPQSGVVFDQAGNMYGALSDWGPGGCGALYKLLPSGTRWTEQVLIDFDISNGGYALGALIMDAAGNLFGTSSAGGSGGGGTVFEISPNGNQAIFKTLYSFPGYWQDGPQTKLLMDAAGNLYGTTYGDGGHFAGSVFKLVPQPDGTWSYVSLHDFLGGPDGGGPISDLVFDAQGNLYGTASYGGTSRNCYHGCGVVFEITP